MIVWIDAQLSPHLAPWVTSTFGVEALAIRDLGLRDAKDRVIYQAAREADMVVMTKDSDFRVLLEQMGPSLQILWITCGNTSNTRLRELLISALSIALELLERGEPLEEISDAKW